MLQRVSAGSAGGIERIVDGAELAALGGFSTAVARGRAPSGLQDRRRAHRRGGPAGGRARRHARLPPRPRETWRPSFFIVGEGIPAGRSLGQIDMRDVAPTLAARLGVTLPRAQGRNRLM